MRRHRLNSGEMRGQMDIFSCTTQREFRRDSSLGLLAVALAVVLSSCSWMGVGSVSPLWRDGDAPAVEPSSKRVYYNIDLSLEYGAIAGAIRQGFGTDAGRPEAVYISEPPKDEIFYKVTLDRRPRSALSNFWGFLSVLSLGILPFYDHEGERVTVRYDLYVDRQFKRSYAYLASRRGLFWLGAPLVKPLLPSDWSESIVARDVWLSVFRTTARQVMADVKRDGILGLQ